MDSDFHVYIETDRLFLRRFELADLQSFVKYRNDPDVAQFQSWELPFTENKAVEFIKEHANYEIGVRGKWHQIAIADKKISILIGDCGINTSIDGKQAEFGITIAKNFQNKGFAFEALYALFDCLFRNLKYHRITALVDSNNKSSIALMKKLHMRQEAYFIESYFGRELNWTDEVQFAILEKEYLEEKQKYIK